MLRPWECGPLGRALSVPYATGKGGHQRSTAVHGISALTSPFGLQAGLALLLGRAFQARVHSTSVGAGPYGTGDHARTRWAARVST